LIMPIREENIEQQRIVAPPSIDATPELSASVQEIISSNPGQFLKNGTSVIFGILLLVIAGMWFIKYPDVLEGKSILTTYPLPIKLKAQSGGRILRLFVKEGSSVKKDANIAELENSTGYEAILVLQKINDSTKLFLQQGNLHGLSVTASQELQSLGDAQPVYNQLLQSVNTFLLMKKEHVYAKRTANIEVQSSSYQSLSKISNEEMRMIEEELKQADERFIANEQLYKDKVISKQEYFDEAARVRQRRISMEQQKRGKLQNNISIGDNKKQLLEIGYEKEEKENAAIIAIQEATRNLQNFIQSWKLKYLLVAPYDGQIQYLRPMHKIPGLLTKPWSDWFKPLHCHGEKCEVARSWIDVIALDSQ